MRFINDHASHSEITEHAVNSVVDGGFSGHREIKNLLLHFDNVKVYTL